MKKVLNFLLIIVFLAGVVTLNSCKKDEIPVVTTTAASGVTTTTAVSGGNVTDDGGAEVTARGVCWGTSANPTISGSKTTDGKGTGSFSSNLTGLTPGTKYYVRAYATNSVGTAYGNEIDFTTTALAGATVTTNEVTVFSYTTATAGGNVTATGGDAVTARGVCYGTTANPTISGTHTEDGTGIGAFTSNLTGLTSGTKYYVRAYATNSTGTEYGAQVEFTTLAVTEPAVSTGAVSSITDVAAKVGGNVTATNGGAITERGICWGTSENPTVDDESAEAELGDDGTGTFTADLTGLTMGTTYYARAYAKNSAGISYGDAVTFNTLLRDVDNNLYEVVKIGSALWMAENLATTKYNGGGDIPTGHSNDEWKVLSTAAYCWYNGAVANKELYGALYNWYAASNANICPTGWHLPTDAEFKNLEMALGMTQGQADGTDWRGTDQGTRMKSESGWADEGNGTNSSGFNAVPGGFRYYDSGAFMHVGNIAYFWTSTQDNVERSWIRQLEKAQNGVQRQNGDKKAGKSIRCVKN